MSAPDVVGNVRGRLSDQFEVAQSRVVDQRIGDE
jgi:hypothetical protein